MHDLSARACDQVEDALAKCMEAPPQKKAKALPCPDEKHKKKRGGKRARAIKEKYAQSEMIKLANRVQFGVQEAEVFGGTDETVGLGSLGKIAAMHSGRLRVAKKEVKLLNTKAKERNGLSSQVRRPARPLPCLLASQFRHSLRSRSDREEGGATSQPNDPSTLRASRSRAARCFR